MTFLPHRALAVLAASSWLLACTYDFGAAFNGAGEGGAGGLITTTSVGGGATTTTTTTTTTTSSTTTSSSSTGEPPTPIPIGCGGSLQCDLNESQACCWSNPSSSGTCMLESELARNCNVGPNNSQRRTRITCQYQEHCPSSTICCARGPSASNPEGSFYRTHVECASSCDDPRERLCNPEADPSECPTGYDCVAGTLVPPAYFFCEPGMGGNGGGGNGGGGNDGGGGAGASG